ncbi:MAG: hypothetical protein EA412_01785 [Chitinophagaceae bacterium]|nr:MAG: hypothetical protein EA412_01785 [Chitinophagaceae bacterium]
MSAKWLLYGANGYTGKLILEAAAQSNNLPIISGRNSKQIEELADKYGCQYLISNSENLSEKLNNQFGNIKLILNCAGPFVNTYKGVIKACLDHSIHYTDITGEWTVMEALAAFHQEAVEKNIVVMPGVGFDVVPTDCLALKLSGMISNPEKLILGFAGMNKASRGTLKSAVYHADKGNYIRLGGKIQKIPFKNTNECIEINKRKFNLINIPWGDIFTAYYTTNIQNIEVQTSVSKKAIKYISSINLLKHIFKIGLLKNLAINYINNKLPEGPEESDKKDSVTYVFGKVTNSNGESADLCWSTPDGYTLTVMTSLKIIEFILNDPKISGFKTPAGAYGFEWFLNLENINTDITKKSC